MTLAEKLQKFLTGSNETAEGEDVVVREKRSAHERDSVLPRTPAASSLFRQREAAMEARRLPHSRRIRHSKASIVAASKVDDTHRFPFRGQPLDSVRTPAVAYSPSATVEAVEGKCYSSDDLVFVSAMTCVMVCCLVACLVALLTDRWKNWRRASSSSFSPLLEVATLKVCPWGGEDEKPLGRSFPWKGSTVELLDNLDSHAGDPNVRDENEELEEVEVADGRRPVQRSSSAFFHPWRSSSLENLHLLEYTSE
ncbi:unnamed protein product [Darwinula stevensoni]|uniref:Transmembrane protein n=1 Tax=Darwinula stevensoni TaxID=69355 RepID=A0A7R9A8S4_9CRUS|nr:unnamed protein product [Darwinula stevensoni]CAG0896538.1 unnamed protein product [Darwinula stevensoni]